MAVEQIPHTEAQPTNETLVNTAHAVFGEILQSQALAVGEIADKQEAIARVGNELIDQYGIKSSLFEDPGRGFVFTAIAEAKSVGNPEDNDFVSNALAMLAHNHSDILAPAKKLITPNEETFSQAHEDSVHDKYTHQQLSAELSEAMHNGDLLNGVKSRLGITPENEYPYEVRVLTVEDGGKTNFGMDSFGIDTPFTTWEEIPGDTISEKTAYAMSEQQDREDLNRHKKDLLERGNQMAAELGHPIARAWVTTRENGQRVLNVSMPMAEKLLDPSITENSKIYSEKNREADFSVLEHEYVHTQGGLNVDNDVLFGISLEERRAEYYSGDRNGYNDIKGLFLDVAVASGVYATNLFDKSPLGGQKSDVYADLANRLGIRNTLELLILPPQAYVDRAQGNVLQEAVVNHIGGYDGLLKRVLDKSLAEGQETAIDERVRDRAEIISMQGEYVEWILNYRRKFGLNVMTDLYQSAIDNLGIADQ